MEDFELEKLLEQEADAYRPLAALMRKFASHIRGLNKISIDDLEIKMHVDACRDYYLEFHTTSGKDSPWLLKG